MLESQKLVGSGPVQPVRCLRLCSEHWASLLRQLRFRVSICFWLGSMNMDAGLDCEIYNKVILGESSISSDLFS